MKILKYVQEEENFETSTKDMVLPHYNVQPYRYEELNGGVYWRSSTSLESFVDVIIHLLFLETIKATK